MRPTPDAALAFLKAHEGCRLDAYRDSAGVWTIGYGHTPAHEGQTIDQAQANRAAERLAGVVDPDTIEALTDNEYAALVSFVFNLGARPEWTVWARLKEGRLSDVPEQMARFVYAGGQKVQGLVNRRDAEIALWKAPHVA